jgi:hypothetical protein
MGMHLRGKRKCKVQLTSVLLAFAVPMSETTPPTAETAIASCMAGLDVERKGGWKAIGK